MGDITGYHHSHSTQSSKVLFIDSKDATQRHQGETTHFTYLFRDSIIVQKNEGVLLSLLQASIPYSFYNVREGVNDTIDVMIDDALGTSLYEKAIVFPPGNYTAISMANQFKAQLEQMFREKPGDRLDATVTIDYDRDTQKFKFSIDAVPFGSEISQGYHRGRVVILILSHGVNKNTHFDVELGFDSDTASRSVFFRVSNQISANNLNTNQGAGSCSVVPNADNINSVGNFIYTPNVGFLVSANIADLNGSVHALYLRTNLPVLSTMDSLTGGLSNIVAKIPINTGPGGIIFHEPRDSIHKSLIHTRAIKALEIRITDDRNRIVSLNGLHFSIALQLEFVNTRRNIQPLDPRQTLPYGYRGDTRNNIVHNNITNESNNKDHRSGKTRLHPKPSSKASRKNGRGKANVGKTKK